MNVDVATVAVDVELERPTVAATYDEPDCAVAAGHGWRRLPSVGTEVCLGCGTRRWLDRGAEPTWCYAPNAEREWIRARLAKLDADDLVRIERDGWRGIGQDPATRWWATFDGVRIVAWRADGPERCRDWLDKQHDAREW